MTTKDTLIRGYAEAIYSIAQAEGDLDRVEGELFDFAKALEVNAELREALTDPGLPADRKKAVIGDLMGGKASPHTVSAIEFVIENGRARELGKIIDELATVAAAKRQSSLAEVRTAVALTDKQRDAIKAALSKAVGREVEVRTVVDPSVLGGVVARIGDEVIDGSVASRLAAAREQLGS